jgi:hypothetical protein
LLQYKVPAPNDRQDTLGTELLGDIFYNLWFNVTPRRDNALTGDPGIMLVGESALLPTYSTIQPDAPILNRGEMIIPLTDGFTDSAPDIRAVGIAAAFAIPSELKEADDEWIAAMDHPSGTGYALDCVQPAAALGPRSLLPSRQPRPHGASGIFFLISHTPHA